jgi:hypothetical protein
MEILHEETRACDQCGAALRKQARFCEACGAAAGPAAARACASCGAMAGPGARFCAQCGGRVGVRASPVHARWKQLRSQAAEVDWERVGRLALPAAALLLAGLLGYGLGRQEAKPTGSVTGAVTQTQGWRAQTASAKQAKISEETEGPVVKSPDAPAAAAGAERPTAATGPLTRFRDFEISASSWELAHPPVHASDGDPYTFWHAWKSERFAEGEWLTLTFPTERVVTRIGLLPGRMGAGARAEGRVRSVMVKAGDEPPQKLFFQDRPAMQHKDLKTPLRTRKLVLRVVTVLPGRETKHIVVPEVQVWGNKAPDEIARRADG